MLKNLLATVVGLVVAGALAVDGAPTADPKSVDRGAERAGAGTPPGDPGPVPHLPAGAAAEAFEVPDGFTVDVIAAEPLVEDPVAAAFDDLGRLHVVEMTTYMRNVLGEGEVAPEGKIVRLEDLDGDGFADERRVLIDGIVLPRALVFVGNGFLYADHNDLRFATLENGEVVADEVADAGYSGDGNVEYRANGLYYGLDNWIRSAMTERLYRALAPDAPMPPGAFEVYRNDVFKLVRRDGYSRGQWGIAEDDSGRVYTTTNSQLVLADTIDHWAVHGTGDLRLDTPPVTALSDNRVAPAVPTRGINRALNDGVLDDDGRLVRATSAAGLAVYRGHNYPRAYEGLVFTAEPAAFLVTATDVTPEGGVDKARLPFASASFLRSREHRFRPVNLVNAPDGSLFLVDMHRGLIQHRKFMTRYLQDYTTKRGLDETFATGRVFRVRHKDGPLEERVDLVAMEDAELAALLDHPAGWQRDRARRLLIERHTISSTARTEVMRLAQEGSGAGRLAALWTLEGLRALSADMVATALHSADPSMQRTGLKLIASLPKKDRHTALRDLPQSIRETEDREIAVLAVYALAAEGGAEHLQMIADMTENWDKDDAIPQAVVAGFSDAGADAASAITTLEHVGATDLATRIRERVSRYREEQDRQRVSSLPDDVRRRTFAKGRSLYEGTAGCIGCHGSDGQGAVGLAPKLAGSEWVTGSKDRYIALVLKGLIGPIDVDGEVFDAGIAMPALLDNPALGDTDRAAVLTYVRNAWGNAAGAVSPEDIGDVRIRFQDRDAAFSSRELNEAFPSPAAPKVSQ